MTSLRKETRAQATPQKPLGTALALCPHPPGGVQGPSDRLPGTLTPVTVTEPARGAWPAPTQGDTQVGRKLLPGGVAVLFPGGDAGCQAGTPLQSAWSPLRPAHSRDTARLQFLGLFSV